ncbi:PAAR-like protein [Flavobacterium sp. J27]|uniref:PAAR-like protein n=1 Tax=Flavobacterium sp. J27 TaxID=2060419 RepID=UPI00197A7296
MSDKHILVQGATVKCKFSVEPKTDKIKVLSQSKHYANDSDGSEKLIATTKEVGQTLEKNTFGKCKLQPTSSDYLPCKAVITQWTDFYQKVTLSNKGQILTEESKATCPIGGAGCITVENHGQKGAASSQDVQTTDDEVASNLNPAADMGGFKQDENQKLSENDKEATEKEITAIQISSKSKKITYGSTLDVVVQTTGMQNDFVELTLYEDDANGSGHNSINNKNLLQTKKVQIGSQGVATTQFLLQPDFQKIANAYNASEGSQHEFYVAAYYLGSLKAASENVNVSNPAHVETRKKETTKVLNGEKPVKEEPVSFKAKAGSSIPVKEKGISKVTLAKNGSKKLLATVFSSGLTGKTIRFKVMEEDYLSHDTLVDKKFVLNSDAHKIDVFLDRIPQSLGGGYWSEGDFQELFVDVQVEDTQSHILSETIDVDISSFKVEVAENKTVTVIDSEEDVLAAYFAKKEYIEKTTEDGGAYTYTFGGTKANNKTSTTAEKEAVAQAILTKGKVNDKLKAEKKYTTKEAIVESLTASEYGRDTESNKTVELKTFKLGPKFIRINSAPLEAKVYLVVETGSLNGKSVKVSIKEKDGIIKGSADSILPVIQITEQQMDDDSASGEGTEKSEFTATVENGIAKIPIQLRPKSDEDFEQWKEKITKGKKEGDYTYTFSNTNGTTITEENKARLAGIILTNAKEGKLGNPKIENGKTAYQNEIENALEIKTYNKGDTITFPTYKKEPEMLWLDVSCSGNKKEHHKEFLKKEGSYFVIGGGSCCLVDSEFFFKQYQTEFGETLTNDNKESLKKMFKSTAEYYSNEKRKCNLKHIAYMLATSKLETANTFNPINEYGGNTYFEQMYDPILGKNEKRRNLSIANGNTTQGDGVKYHGRGFVQLTWKDNYQKMKDKFNVDLINNPEKALEHELAMKIMIFGMEDGTFTGKKLADYINDNKTDYLNARRIINGTDRASDIKEYAEKIEKCLKIECSCDGADSSSSNVNIHFVGQSAHENAVSQSSRQILQTVGEASNNLDIYITSTARTPHDQARIMYDNCQADLQEQRETYRAPGQRVIDVYESNQEKERSVVISLMEAKINELGPSTVSLHCADSNTINVFDISIRRLTNPADFLTEIQSRTEVSRVLTENGVYHVEIPQ